ncbi:Alpha/beta hydrolase fold-1 [Xylariaceae sp. FL0016]|nr:Alpha/beta hydrolase fold-1 [Xylariaceae sp. FL0016]
MTEESPVFVSVHGAWHSPACWDDVRAKLEKKEWKTEAIAHPSTGARSADVGLEDDAAAIRRVLNTLCDEGKKIVLVVHSFGGCPGANASRAFGFLQRAASGRSGGIVMFAYLCAFVIPKRSSLVGVIGGKLAPFVRLHDNDFVTPDTPEDIFYNDVQLNVQHKFVQALRPEPRRVFYDLVDYEPWNDMPCAYLFTTKDHAIPLELQKDMALRLGSSTPTATFEGSHSPFLSDPRWVAEKVEWLARLGLDKTREQQGSEAN